MKQQLGIEELASHSLPTLLLQKFDDSSLLYTRGGNFYVFILKKHCAKFLGVIVSIPGKLRRFSNYYCHIMAIVIFRNAILSPPTSVKL
jgi:hypothetical protein